MNPTAEKFNKIAVIRKAHKRSLHFMNPEQYEAIKNKEDFKRIWRLATIDELIAHQERNGKKVKNETAFTPKKEDAPKPKEQPKEKVILRSDPIQEIKPEKKEIKKDEFEINS